MDNAAVRRLQIGVLMRAVEDYLSPDTDSRREEVERFFKNPRCEFLFNPFERITLPEMLEVLKNGSRLDA